MAKTLSSARDILLNNDFLARLQNGGKYVSTEFQDYGLRLASRLNDMAHKTLYIKLAKEVPRDLLEKAASFAIDYPNAPQKGKIFMWKLSQLSPKLHLYPRKKPGDKQKPVQKQMSLI